MSFIHIFWSKNLNKYIGWILKLHISHFQRNIIILFVRFKKVMVGFPILWFLLGLIKNLSVIYTWIYFLEQIYSLFNNIHFEWQEDESVWIKKRGKSMKSSLTQDLQPCLGGESRTPEYFLVWSPYIYLALRVAAFAPPVVVVWFGSFYLIRPPKRLTCLG